MRITSLALLAVLLLGAACRHAAAPPDASREAADAAFCKEHGVPESACTICHPDLIAGFKAKGDWCEEHGYPESVCPICKGTMPAAKPAGPPESGTVVRLRGHEAARAAGIATEAARAASASAEVSALARLVPDPARTAVVNARASGVVTALGVEVGDAVERGARLATVESASVGESAARRRAADARAQAAEADLARDEELARQGIVSQKGVVAARKELGQARAEQAAAAGALGMVGASRDAKGYDVVAPIAGRITRRAATIGSLVEAGDVVFEILDASTLVAEIDVPEGDAADLAAGDEVTLTFAAPDGLVVDATLRSVDAAVQPQSRTVRARAVLVNTDGRLRSNAMARAAIRVEASGEAVLVPRGAVQTINDAPLVFVRQADDAFAVRRVRLGASRGEDVELLEGVVAGEPVVVAGSFQLKTELMRDAIGAGCCDVE